MLIAIDDMTDVEEEFFSIEQDRTFTQLPERTAFKLDIFLDKDLTRVERTVYNTFMLLGDVGGLYEFISVFFLLIMGVVNFAKPANILSADLFENKSAPLAPTKQSSIKGFFQQILPRCCRRCPCLRLSPSDRLFGRARDILNDELDVVNLLQRLRFFDNALSRLIQPNELAELRLESKRKHLTVGPEDAQAQVGVVSTPQMDDSSSQRLQEYKDAMENPEES